MRQILGLNVTCACGMQNRSGAPHCARCGQPLSQGGSPSVAASRAATGTTAHPTSANSGIGLARGSSASPQHKFAQWFALETLQGTVVDTGRPYTTPGARRWWKILATVALIPVIAGALIAWLLIRSVFSWVARLFEPRGTIRVVSGRGFLGGLMSDIGAYYVAGRFLKPVAPLSVRDYRVRDANGAEHLVRVQGHLRSGTMDVGDDVRLEGRNRHGTLILVRGTNDTLRALIEVSR